jgi:hypothetical protein
LLVTGCILEFTARVEARPGHSKKIPGGLVMIDDEVALSAKVAVSAGGLQLQYRVSNQLPVPIYVFNKLWKRANHVLDSEQIYRYLVGSTLRLLLGPAPVPLGLNVRVRNIPWVTKIEAHQVFEAALSLPVPSKEYSAYFDAGQASYVSAKARQVELFVSYRRGGNGLETAPVPEAPGTLQITSPAPGSGAELLRSGPTALPIDVLVTHSQDFERLEMPDDPR